MITSYCVVLIISIDDPLNYYCPFLSHYSKTNHVHLVYYAIKLNF